jgi:phosphoglycerol transferase
MGGFGSMFAWLVSPQIRTYCRINVVIGFLALFAFALLVERLHRRWPSLAPATSLLLVLGLLDQVTPAAVRPYAAVKAEFAADADFVQRIEAMVPPGSMIFELPYQSFPEAGPVRGMGDYDFLRLYLHSHTLRWSYPAMRGRADAKWLRDVAGHAPARLVEELSDVGFQGIAIDRRGYADRGSDIESALARLLGVKAEVSRDGRVAFFPMGPFNQRTARESAEERELRRDRALHPLAFHWGAGFYEVEIAPGGPFRWADQTADIEIENGARVAQRASLRFSALPAQPPARLQIEGDLLGGDLELVSSWAQLERVFDVPPGRHLLRFRCDGKPADAPHDPRSLIWRAQDPVLEEVPPNAGGASPSTLPP